MPWVPPALVRHLIAFYPDGLMRLRQSFHTLDLMRGMEHGFDEHVLPAVFLNRVSGQERHVFEPEAFYAR